jgi:hypothetical protein
MRRGGGPAKESSSAHFTRVATFVPGKTETRMGRRSSMTHIRPSDRVRRAAVGIAALCLLAALVGGGGVYRAILFVPGFYRERIESSADDSPGDRQAMIRQIAETHNQWAQSSPWRLSLSDADVNDWLAAEIDSGDTGLLPPQVRRPRVAFEQDQLRIAYQEARWPSPVISVDLDVRSAGCDELSISVAGAKAGLIPIPLAGILDQISAACRDWDLHLEWQQTGGRPTALIHLDGMKGPNKANIRLDALRLAPGRIEIQGFVESQEPEAAFEPQADVDESTPFSSALNDTSH